MTPRLQTDWGTIDMPADMVGLCPLTKHGEPDRRYRGADRWWERFHQEAAKLKCLVLQGKSSVW